MSKEVAKRKQAEVEANPAIDRVVIRPAKIEDLQAEVGAVEGLPSEFEKSETMAGFPPSPKFEKRGDTIFGDFVGVRLGVGPNKSRVYELNVPNGDNSSFAVAVWGSTALDRLFDSAFPPIQQGDKLAFIYLGEKGTKRGLNPVKLFAMKIRRQTV